MGTLRAGHTRSVAPPSPVAPETGGRALDFKLTEEQLELKKWAHEFAEREIRPVAAEYDESEEFPWPVVKKAAEAGLYSIDLYMQAQQDPTGLTLPLVMEEIFWGCAGIGLVDLRHRPTALGARRGRHPGATLRVGAEDVRHPGGPEGRRLRRHGTAGRVGCPFAAHPREARGR